MIIGIFFDFSLLDDSPFDAGDKRFSRVLSIMVSKN